MRSKIMYFFNCMLLKEALFTMLLKVELYKLLMKKEVCICSSRSIILIARITNTFYLHASLNKNNIMR